MPEYSKGFWAGIFMSNVMWFVAVVVLKLFN